MTRPAFPLRALPMLLATVLASPAAWAQAAAPAAAPTDVAALAEMRATTLALIEALVEQGLLSRARADELLRKARSAGEQAALQATARAEPPPAGSAPAAVAGTAAVAGAAGGATAGAAGAAAATWGQPRNVVRVPYLPDSAKAQIKEDIRNDVLATAREEGWADARKLPGWVRGLSFSGDVRTRAQGENFAADNVAPEVFRSQTDSPAWAPDLTNTRTDRKRMTVRARVAVAAKASDSLNAGVRITTGSSTGSLTSASQTAGNGFNRYGVSMDRAFIRWEPSHLLRMEAGRMAVPFDHTDLLFPDDLSLDGVAAKGELDLASGMFGFAVAGAFPLEEFASTARDKYLLGGQMGLDWALDSDWKLRAAVGLYEFRNIAGERESALPPTGALAGTTGYQSSQYLASIRQKGNTLINLNAPGSTASPVWGLASKFRPVDLTLSLTARHFMPYELGFVLNVVKNTAFDKADIARRAGTAAVNDLVDMTNGYQMRLNFGAARMDEPGAWSTYLAFRKFERDAWVDAYTDTTWHLGGTNYKGFSLGGLYAFDNKATVGARLTSTRNLDDGVRYGSGSALSGNLSSAPLKIDVVQVDVNFRF